MTRTVKPFLLIVLTALTATAFAQSADVNGDGVINGADINLTATNFGTSNLTFDTDMDGDVDWDDQFFILQRWDAFGDGMNSPCVGDVTADGVIDASDANIALSLNQISGTSLLQGDFSGDNFTDFQIDLFDPTNFTGADGEIFTDVAFTACTMPLVPEPSSLGLIMVASLGLLLGRKRR